MDRGVSRAREASTSAPVHPLLKCADERPVIMQSALHHGYSYHAPAADVIRFPGAMPKAPPSLVRSDGFTAENEPTNPQGYLTRVRGQGQ